MPPAGVGPQSGIRPTLIAGVPDLNMALYHRIRFIAGDPAALISLPGPKGIPQTTLIIRDIEVSRARAHVRVDQILAPADCAPAAGLSGDRPTATAQATAEFLRRTGVSELWTDRTLPMIFAHHVLEAGIALHYDPELGVRDRRSKDAQEVEWMHEAQHATEGAIEMACRMIAGAKTGKGGVLEAAGAPLTSERVCAAIDIWLMERGYENPRSIVAGGPQGGDCHAAGTGPLFTEQPVIVDVFPRSKKTRYYGDCTRMVVHGPAGNIPDPVRRMHVCVAEAKRAAIGAVRAGVSGEEVHRAAIAVITGRGYATGLPTASDPPSRCAMVHGTGHGLGLDLKEQPLLDIKGPALVEGDAITVEPGLYQPDLGGMRLEDLLIVRRDGCDNLNALHEGLTWT